MVSLDVASESQVAVNYSEVIWKRLDALGVHQFEVNKASQMLLDGVSAGPVAGFVLPGDRGSLDIELESFVSKELSFYAPNVVVLNRRNKVIYQGRFADFTYNPAKLMDEDNFSVDFNVIPDMSGDELKMLIYTSAADLQGETEVLHPAKAFAKAKHTQPPDIANPMAKHAPFGSFRLTIKANDVVNKRVVANNDHAPEGTELKGYYHEAIQKAVQEDNIPKASVCLMKLKRLI